MDHVAQVTGHLPRRARRAADAPEVRQVTVTQPLRWLKRGWEDLSHHPAASLGGGRRSPRWRGADRRRPASAAPGADAGRRLPAAGAAGGAALSCAVAPAAGRRAARPGRGAGRWLAQRRLARPVRAGAGDRLPALGAGRRGELRAAVRRPGAGPVEPAVRRAACRAATARWPSPSSASVRCSRRRSSSSGWSRCRCCSTARTAT